MDFQLDQLSGWVMEYLPSVLAALAILVIGWLVALLLAAVMRGIVRRTSSGAALTYWLKGEEQGEPHEAERWAGKVVFYLAMLFVLIAFFQFLGLTFVAEPLRGFLNQVFEYAPRLLGAGILLLLAWIVAMVLRMAITRLLSAAKIDERLGEQAAPGEERKTSLVQTLANVVYWLVFLFFLPAILTVLALEGLLVPVQEMFVVVLGFLPNIFAAALILVAGWFGARILQRLVTKVVEALGIDRVSDSAGATTILGEQKLSGLVGILAYTLVIVFTIIAALNALALEAITAPASNMLELTLQALPAILAAVLVLTIAYLAGKVLAGLATNVLSAAGFNNILQRLGLNRVSLEGKKSPSEIVGYLVLIAVMLFAAIEASGLLGFALVADLISQFTVILAQVAVGLLIFGIGLYLAGVAHEAVSVSGGAHAGILARLARVSILILAGVMALNQMGVAQEIIVIGFAILLGAVALIAVVAFGIGGRDLAAREMEQWIKQLKSRE